MRAEGSTLAVRLWGRARRRLRPRMSRERGRRPVRGAADCGLPNPSHGPVSETGASAGLRHTRSVRSRATAAAAAGMRDRSRGRAGLGLAAARAASASRRAWRRASSCTTLAGRWCSGRLGLGDRPDEVQMAVHLVSSRCHEGRPWRPPSQRAPRAKSEMSCGVAVSKPTTSSIPGSAGSAIEKPFETKPTTTSRASMPDAWRWSRSAWAGCTSPDADVPRVAAGRVTYLAPQREPLREPACAVTLQVCHCAHLPSRCVV